MIYCIVHMLRNLRNPWLIVSVLLGLIQVWVGRFLMSGDGISYLDMGQAYLRGDWHTAINGFWNPLYAWLQAIGYVVFRPSPYWEYPVVQLVNFGIFVTTACAFEYFLIPLVRGRDDETGLRFIAYALFLWSSLQLIGVFSVNPDMLLAGATYAAFGILARDANKWSPLALALSLVWGYYAKAFFFPVAAMILVSGLAVLSRRRQIWMASAIFAVICCPLVIALSLHTGHLTIGDTGRLNYAWFVNHVESRLWQGGPPRSGRPVHPPRILLDSPRVYEFDGVFPVSNPVWYDESYWYQGLKVWVEPRDFARVVRRNVQGIAKVLILQSSGFLIGGLLAFLLRRLKPLRLPSTPFLLAWGVSVASIMLLCAVHVETRYIASFVTIIFLIPFACFRICRTSFGIAIAVMGLVSAAWFTSLRPWQGSGNDPFLTTPENEQWILATSMEHLGLVPGDKFATVCCDGSVSMKWAHLVHMHLVACFDWDSNFWQLREEDQRRVLAALDSTPAKVAVSEIPPPDPERAAGWQRVGLTRYYIHVLSSGRQQVARNQTPVAATDLNVK